MTSEARLIQLEDALGEAGQALVENMRVAELDRKKAWKRTGGPSTVSEQIAAKSGATIKGVLDQDKYLKSAFISQDAINIAKKVVLPVVIRRTGKSKQPDGEPVLSIEPYVQSIVWVSLKQVEWDNVEKVSNSANRDGT